MKSRHRRRRALLNDAEVAIALGVTEQQVREWREKGYIVKRKGRLAGYSLPEVQKALAARGIVVRGQ